MALLTMAARGAAAARAADLRRDGRPLYPQVPLWVALLYDGLCALLPRARRALTPTPTLT